MSRAPTARNDGAFLVEVSSGLGDYGPDEKDAERFWQVRDIHLGVLLVAGLLLGRTAPGELATWAECRGLGGGWVTLRRCSADDAPSPRKE